MLTGFRMICCTIALPALAVLVAAQGDVTSVVEKAIKAHGGEERLAKFKAIRMKATGTIDVQGQSVEFSALQDFQAPNKSRGDIKLKINGQTLAVVQVHDGKKAWESTDGTVKELADDELANLVEQDFGSYLETLVPLLRDKSVAVKLVGEEKIDGKLATSILVSSRGFKDRTFYFDQDSGLLVKTKRKGKNLANEEVDVESFYRNYKDCDGVKQAMKQLVTHDGSKFMDVAVSEVKMLEKLDDSTFAEPK